VAVGAPLVILLPPRRRVTLGAIVLAIIAFGWLMPYLAEWSQFDS
jgi:hypothetical protein